MIRIRTFLLLILFTPVTCCQGASQLTVQPKLLRPQPTNPDLATVLIQMAQVSHVPIIAELVQPVPRVQIKAGTEVSSDALNELVRQAVGYEWRQEGKSIHFYNKKLRHAQYNPLNLKFAHFSTPANLSEMKLWFPTRVIGLLHGYSAEGAAISGFNDPELEKQTLQKSDLRDISGLDILLHLANESPTFYTVIVFPQSTPTKEQAEQVSNNWFWGSLTAQGNGQPIYIQEHH